jgi:hypothetical protein
VTALSVSQAILCYSHSVRVQQALGLKVEVTIGDGSEFRISKQMSAYVRPDDLKT